MKNIHLKNLLNLPHILLPQPKILTSPHSFKNTIFNLLKNSNNVHIICLYLGDGILIKEFFELLKFRKSKNLLTKILVDMNRANRKTNFFKLVDEYSVNNFFYFYDTCLLNLPSQIKELIGVLHVKLFVFDEIVLMTGANLEDSYFINRQDRYFVFKNSDLSKLLVNQFYYIIKNQNLIGGFKVFKPDSKVYAHEIKDTAGIIYPMTIESSKNIDSLIKPELKSLLDVKLSNNISINRNINEPINSNINLIIDEYSILKLILEIPFDTIYISTGYLNLPNSYIELLKPLKINLLIPGPKSTTYKGLKIIKQFYSSIAFNIKKKLINCKMYEYSGTGTFHSKGIWGFSKKYCITTIGSSNLNIRGKIRDSEQNMLILTENINLIKELKNEVINLMTKMKEVSLEELEKRVTFVGKLGGYVFKKYL